MIMNWKAFVRICSGGQCWCEDNSRSIKVNPDRCKSDIDKWV
ncbi:MAG TPA: hypothetical protein VF324_00460 [Methanobacterium sp.]